VARKRIRRKPGKLVVPVSNAQTPRPLAPSSSSLNINSSNNIAEAEVTELHQLSNDQELQTQQIKQTLSPNRATNGSNNNPSSSNHKNSNLTQSHTQNIVKHKKTVKESLESKRERKAAKTLAIITGYYFY